MLLDNCSNAFSSASKALNYGVKQAKGDVLVFLHQDIEFIACDILSYIYDFAMEHQNAVFGAAGVKARQSGLSDGKILTSMYRGPDKIKQEDDSISQPMECFTLDECLIACHRHVMDLISFDEKVCDGWHLYGADLCLQACMTDCLSVMTVPLDIWHKSNGNADKSYMKTQDRLAEKYHKVFKVINTTNGFQYTDPVRRFLVNFYRKLRYHS